VPLDEALRIVGKTVVTVECPFQQFARNVLRNVARPSLGGVEGDYPDSVSVLTGEKIADDAFAIGLGGVGLDVGRAELPRRTLPNIRKSSTVARTSSSRCSAIVAGTHVAPSEWVRSPST
jgi:hypothetical protein